MTASITAVQLEEKLFEIAQEFAQQGPGYAQDMIVLREAVERLGIADDLSEQQRLLTAWHNLFRSGRLAWGYDVDNPSSPFFHISPKD